MKKKTIIIISQENTWGVKIVNRVKSSTQQITAAFPVLKLGICFPHFQYHF